KMYQLGDEKQTSVDLKYNIRGLLYSAHRTQENTLDPSNPWDRTVFAEKRSRGGRRLARLDISGTTTTRRWMHPDHLGTTGCITKDGDPQGQAETITLYLPYGAGPSASLRESTFEEKSEAGFRDPYGFTGNELEVDLGIMYFGARWYNPQLGRWLSPDPLYLVSTAKNAEKDQNIYHYAGNNPWKFVDPDGTTNQSPKMSDIHKLDKSAKIVISTEHDDQYNEIVKVLTAEGFSNFERLKFTNGTPDSTQLESAQILISMGHHQMKKTPNIYYGPPEKHQNIDFSNYSGKLKNLKVFISDACRTDQGKYFKSKLSSAAPNLSISILMHSRSPEYSCCPEGRGKGNYTGSFGTTLVQISLSSLFLNGTFSQWKNYVTQELANDYKNNPGDNPTIGKGKKRSNKCTPGQTASHKYNTKKVRTVSFSLGYDYHTYSYGLFDKKFRIVPILNRFRSHFKFNFLMKRKGNNAPTSITNDSQTVIKQSIF
ncbi:RHS repeat-associated core domain-containing protein, partial [Myxococcota bacterium]|nr:RHS repeat-associated core domain-containing protein [Myxococcota bacterium]